MMFRRVTARLLTRLPKTTYRGYAEEFLPVDQEKPTLGAPHFSPLPEEYAGKQAPANFAYYNIHEIGIGSIICAPTAWNKTEGTLAFADFFLDSDESKHWIISEEDPKAEVIKRAAIIQNYKNLLSTPHELIDQIESSILGNARWHFDYCNKHGKALDTDLLKNGYGIEPLFLGSLEKGNKFIQTIELNSFRRNADPNDQFSEVDDWYSLTDIFYWKKERWVMAATYQCPLKDVETVKPILQTIRNESVLNYISPLYRVVQSKIGPLVPFPQVGHHDHHGHHDAHHH